MTRTETRFSMAQTEEWLAHLRATNRKENAIATHRSNIYRCLLFLWSDERPTDAHLIDTDDIQYLWRTMPVRESVRMAYLRSLSCMIEHHTDVDLVKRTDILHNRETHDRVFISDGDFRKAYMASDPFQRVILCLGAYMGLRRVEMQSIRDGDIDRDVLTIHGKGHGKEGLIAYMDMPQPVIKAIEEYRNSPMKDGERTDDYLLQNRGHDGRLHRVMLSRISDSITDLARETRVRMTTHSLRRYFATTLFYNTGTDIQTIRRLLRHADVSTTLKCYVDAYDERGREATERLTEHIDRVVSAEMR